ncbi:MAG TPA: hypothetical protein VJ001_06870 [Rhodocyclaceae bacterium]|nr:hypothetical protein [Rhodocyclaceae bacterium]
MKLPSTEWQERIAADEAQRYEDYARAFVAMQQQQSQRYGPGRALHRQAHLALSGDLYVLPDLPDYARHGVFAAPRRFPAWVRLSNGGPRKQSDRLPDVRGFAIKVKDVSGPGALGGKTDCQDFLLINHAAFSFPGSDEFVGLAMNAVKGPAALLKYLFRRYGAFGGLRQIKRLKQTLTKPFTGFATETFYSAAPIACGPYAVKVRLLPASSEVKSRTPPNWADDMAERLEHGDLSFDLQLQFFVDETDTPIEDASKEWTDEVAPCVTVARLVLPRQHRRSPINQELAGLVEHDSFDPWRALQAHRPLGDVMRARKATYFASQKQRAASK